jgi:hypothetical protein
MGNGQSEGGRERERWWVVMFNYGKAKVRGEWWSGGDSGGTSERSEGKVVLG